MAQDVVVNKCVAYAGMAGTAVAAWQQAIRALQECASAPVCVGVVPSTAEAAYKSVQARLLHLFALQQHTPKAVWKKVVLHNEVGHTVLWQT